MSGASSNAAARRRRAAPPANMNRMRQTQQVPQTNIQSNMNSSSSINNHNNMNQSSNIMNASSNNITTEGLPTKNGKMLHPVEILKLFNERLNTLESGNAQNASNNLDTRLINSLTTQMTDVKRKTQEQLVEISELKRNVESQLQDKLNEFEEKINTFNKQIEEMRELCSKIQTFSMETNVSFMLFKNEYEKMKQGSNAMSFMNVFNQFENMCDDGSMEMDEHSFDGSNLIVDEDNVNDDNDDGNNNEISLAIEDVGNDEVELPLQNVENNFNIEIEDIKANISNVIASIDSNDETVVSIHSNVVEEEKE